VALKLLHIDDRLEILCDDGQKNCVALATFPCRKRCGKPSLKPWMQSLRAGILHTQDPARPTCALVIMHRNVIYLWFAR
jgi:hypothetical protein